MRRLLLTSWTVIALCNTSCAFFVRTDGKDCSTMGYFTGESTSPALDPQPSGGTKEAHAAAFDAWKSKANDRYISLKTEAFQDAQKKFLHLGATHISYTDPQVTPQRDKTLKAKATVFAFKCQSTRSFPKDTVPAEEPIRKQDGGSWVE